MNEEDYDNSFKFGDIIENHWASKTNPIRRGIVVRVDPKTIYCTDGKGKFWNLVRDKESQTKIIGSIFPPTPDSKDKGVEAKEILKKHVGDHWWEYKPQTMANCLRAMEEYANLKASTPTQSAAVDVREAAEEWAKNNKQWVPDEQSVRMLYDSFLAGSAYSKSDAVEWQQDFIEDSVSTYFHLATKELYRHDLGTIERKNWEKIKEKCQLFLNQKQKP